MQQAPWYALINGWPYIRADFRMLQLTTRPLWWALRIASGTIDGHRRARQVWPSRTSILDRLEASTLDTLSERELRQRADRLLDELGWWWWEVSWYAAAAIIGESLLTRLRLPGLTDPTILFRGNDSLLLDAERALRVAAQTGDTQGYLARFGHFVESADPIHPTLRESPELLTRHLAVAAQSVSRADQHLAGTRKQRAEAEKIVRAARGLRGALARRLAGVGHSYAAHTDDAVFHFQRVLALIQATYLQLGARLADAGLLPCAENVFYLKSVQAWAVPPDAAALVAQRHAEHARQKKLVPPPAIPALSDSAWVRDPGWKITSRLLGGDALRRGVQERNGRRVLVGMPASPGRARGTARLITGPDDFGRFQPGDVLVAHATTPVWTPLFNLAAAAVTEVGGAFSHAAIVAREFGIPLVNGALDATKDIPDGAPIVVDGSSGTVEL